MPEENSARFSTQGTVQVEVSCGEADDVKIFITPTPGYSVKHGKDDYMVFMQEMPETDAGAKEPDQVLKAQVLKRDKPLTIPNFQSQPALMKMLTDAAIKGLKIQINKKVGKPPSVRIVSFKIPAPL